MFAHYKHLLVAFARDGSYIARIMGGITESAECAESKTGPMVTLQSSSG
jgi:hypothetical protein